MTYRRIVLPRFHAYDSTPKCFQIFQGPRHWRTDRWDTLLSDRGSRVPTLRKALRRCLDRMDAAVMSRNANGTRHVRPDAQSGATIRKERRLATRGPARRVFGRVWVRGSPPDIGGRFKRKESNRDVCLDERIGTGITQDPNNRSILLERDLTGRTGISNTRCKASDAHGIFHADGHPSKGTCLVAAARPSLSLLYHHFS
jgi:hypothetical protein